MVGRRGVGAELQTVDRLLAPAVRDTITALELADEDAAAAKLAESYARELDSAAAVAARARRVLQDAIEQDGSVEIYDQVKALVDQLSARTALANIGPKLATLLAELGATPKARAAITKGGPSAPAGSGKLQAMRGGRSA